MVQSNPADLLSKTIEDIRSFANEKGLVVFFGWLNGSEKFDVEWNDDQGGDWRNFLICAGAVDAKMVYLFWNTFEEFLIEDLLKDELVEQSDLSEEQKLEILEFNSKVNGYRQNIGLTAQVDLAFLHSGLVHKCEVSTEWFKSFLELTGDEDDSIDLANRHEERIRKETQVKDWATKLANHPKYGQCRSNEDREFLLQKLADNAIPQNETYEIIRRAETLYQFEVRESVDLKLQEQILELKALGLNQMAIAQRLGISKNRVIALLPQTKKRDKTE